MLLLALLILLVDLLRALKQFLEVHVLFGAEPDFLFVGRAAFCGHAAKDGKVAAAEVLAGRRLGGRGR